MKIFLDANILFSAAYNNGAVRALVVLCTEKGHQCCTDIHTFEEARRNLLVHRPNAIADLQQVISATLLQAFTTLPSGNVSMTDLPYSDKLVLSAAVSMTCTHFITGDRKHFGKYYSKTIDGVMVVSPQQLYKFL